MYILKLVCDMLLKNFLIFKENRYEMKLLSFSKRPKV